MDTRKDILKDSRFKKKKEKEQKVNITGHFKAIRGKKIEM